MGRDADHRRQMVDLLQGRPGWRLEPRTTPGASPLWCFVVDGAIEFSATVEDGSIRLYVMDTDQEIVFVDADALSAWLQAHRPDALQEAPPRPDTRTRFRRIFEWS